jgi:hypothetical protein
MLQSCIVYEAQAVPSGLQCNVYVCADYYNASALLPLSDDEIIRRTQRHIETCEPGFRGGCFDSIMLQRLALTAHAM